MSYEIVGLLSSARATKPSTLQNKKFPNKDAMYYPQRHFCSFPIIICFVKRNGQTGTRFVCFAFSYLCVGAVALLRIKFALCTIFISLTSNYFTVSPALLLAIFVFCNNRRYETNNLHRNTTATPFKYMHTHTHNEKKTSSERHKIKKFLTLSQKQNTF